jgi:hypothetical protein
MDSIQCLFNMDECAFLHSLYRSTIFIALNKEVASYQIYAKICLWKHKVQVSVSFFIEWENNIKHDLLGNLKFVHDYACIIRPHPLTPPPKIKGKTKTNVLIDRHCLIKIFSHNMKKIVTIIQKFKFSLKIVILKLEKKNVRIFLK